MSYDDRKILEMLEPLVHDELKVWSIMGGDNLELCQSILYQWRIWLRNHWKEDENILTKNVGKYSVWFNVFSKNVILYYALKGYRFFADTQRGEPERLMKMAVKAHAIELGPKYKKPRVVPVDPLRINIHITSAFQRADDLFSNPSLYIKRDTEGKVIMERSGWLPDEGDFSSPIFLWQVLAAYETNLFSHEYFVKAKKLAEKMSTEKNNNKDVKNGDRKHTSNSDTGDTRETKKYFSERLKNILRPNP